MPAQPRFSKKSAASRIHNPFTKKNKKKTNFLGPCRKSSEWFRIGGYLIGGGLVLYGAVLGWQALFENHSVQTAINSVLLILFGLISIYAGSHDQFVSNRLKTDSISRA